MSNISFQSKRKIDKKDTLLFPKLSLQSGISLGHQLPHIGPLPGKILRKTHNIYTQFIYNDYTQC